MMKLTTTGGPPTRAGAVPFRIAPQMGGFIGTVEGNNLYAKYGPKAPEYLEAKKRWLDEQGLKGEKKMITAIATPGMIESREVAEMVGKEHKNLLADIRTYIGYIEESTALKIQPSDFFTESTYQDSTGRTLKCYLITKKGCEMIANKLTGAKGVQFTAAYVTRFNEMEQGETLSLQSLEKALLNPDVLIQLATNLKEEQQKRMRLEEKVVIDQPKVAFAEAVAISPDSILIADMAKLIRQSGVKIGQNRLFEQLRQDGFLCKAYGERRNTPTQRAMEMGLFEVKKNLIATPDGVRERPPTPKITGKGQVYFMNRYGAKEIGRSAH